MGKTNKQQYYLLFFLFSFFIFLFSCIRTQKIEEAVTTEQAAAQTGAKPMAILQPGAQPLWFQLTEMGPVHIESIEDAVFSSALIPWPLSLHARFILNAENSGEITVAVNRYGFIKIAPNTGGADGLALYRFSGGEYWRQYTVGGFVFFDGKPAAVLYLDGRFLDTDISVPVFRSWSFNMESNAPFPIAIPALDLFPAEEGWFIDTLRLGADGYFYYRANKKNGSLPQMRRTANLSSTAAEEISVETFFNSAPRETEFSHPALPELPQGFVYTVIAGIGSTLFACWEEQEEFYTGAAGFVVIMRQ